MKSIFTVVTPASSQDLTNLANVKAELGISGTDEDTNIDSWIDQASSVCADYCNRTFGSETDQEVFRHRFHIGGDLYSPYGGGLTGGGFATGMGREINEIVLRRSPVTAFTSIVMDGITLVEGTDFECEYDSGIVYRLCNGYRTHWRFQLLTIIYTAGYALLGTLPHAIERATITLVKLLRSGANRDPLLISDQIPGVRNVQYAVGRYSGQDTWPPQDVMNALAPYRSVNI